MVKSTIERRHDRNIIQEQRKILKESRRRSSELVKKAEKLGISVNQSGKTYSRERE